MTKTTLTFRFLNKDFDPTIDVEDPRVDYHPDEVIKWFTGTFVKQNDEDGSIDILQTNGADVGHIFTYFGEDAHVGPLQLVVDG